MSCQNFQHSPDCLSMLFHCPSKNENVVQIHHYYALYDEILEDVIHHCLEGSQAVGHSKEHYQGLKQTAVGVEGCLSLVSGFNGYVVETPIDIQYSEVPSFTKLRHELGDQWQWILILHHHGVKSPVVLY